MDNSAPIKVMIWGHSFVRRLQQFIQLDPGRSNLSLTTDKHLVFIRYRGGGRTIHAKWDYHFIRELQAEIVLIDIGTNDIDSQHVSPDVVAQQVFNIAKTLIYFYNVKRVILMEVLFRSESGDFRPLHNKNFVSDAHQYNNKIKILINSQPQRDSAPIVYLHHRGLVQDWCNYLIDGVHLNPQGMLKYFNSIRRAILRITPQVRGTMYVW